MGGANLDLRLLPSTGVPRWVINPMFIVPTYVARSEVHGFGVFAAATIPADQTIWTYVEGVDWKIPPETLASFPEPFQGWMRAYCYLDEDCGLYVLCGDNAKFMNHSPTPNCFDPPGEGTITVRAISAGEELTCDYRMFDGESAREDLTWCKAEKQTAGVE